LDYPVPSEELWVQHLHTNRLETIGVEDAGHPESRLEDYVISGLLEFDDVAYDDQSEVLYDLASQVVEHLRRSLSVDDAWKVLRMHQREITGFVHAQMQDHRWQDESGKPEVKVPRGFSRLRDRAFTAPKNGLALDFRSAPEDRANIARYIFTGFSRGLYKEEKFQSDTERQLAVILDRDCLKWLKPARGQFHVFYRWRHECREYQPDFVAEVPDNILMLEAKAANMMEDREVLAKRDAAVTWCGHASDHAGAHGGKLWIYVLVPHDAIASNMTIGGLVERFAVRSIS
jgi:type III restriction enzyme